MSIQDYSPDEFQEKVRDTLHGEFSPVEFQEIRRLYELDGTDAIKRAARNQLPDDLDDPEPYVEAMAEAFRLELEEDS